jgi:hypothetical protein
MALVPVLKNFWKLAATRLILPLKILKKGGRNWSEGHSLLQELLQQGQQNGW